MEAKSILKKLFLILGALGVIAEACAASEPKKSATTKTKSSIELSFPIEKVVVQGQSVNLAKDRNSVDASELWMKKDLQQEVKQNQQGYVIRPTKSSENTIYSGQNALTLHALSPASMKLYRQFLITSKDMPGLRVFVSDGLVQVQGKFYLLQEWEQLVQAAEKIQGRWLNLTRNSELIQRTIDRRISKALKQKNLLPLLPETGRALLELNNANSVKAYSEVLSPFGIVTSLNAESISLAPMIKVQITVAEVKKSFGQGLGLDWPQQIKATVLPGSAPQYDSLVFGAKAFENSGEGRILASPTLLTRSGKEADFLAGGEFPIKILNFKMQDVIWKQYGIRLKIKPQVDAGGRMSVGIETEVSTIDEAHTVDGVPGMLSNRMTTHLDLQRSKVIALSGLIKSEQGRSNSGLAGLSRIPILGPLFSSEDFRENRSELVIFVRPSIANEF